MDIYAEITNRLVKEMEKGIIPWKQPWQSSGKAISYTTGKPYSLLNQMLLGKAGEYLTFNQVHQQGGFVKKGERAKMVVFWRWLEKENEETGEITQVPYLRYYNVFHISQCEGIKAKYAVADNPNPAKADETAETIISDYAKREGLAIYHKEGNRAYYQPSSDTIVLPLLKQFNETSEYYSTTFHELVHSTGHATRLARITDTAFFGSEAYGKEELVAEIGSAALLHHSGLETPSSFTNNAAYIQNWLQVLKNDKRFIVSAASKADKAVEYILGA